jgi:hypothetical protein
VQNLTAANAFIFRITHIKNVPWILKNGLHCRNSDMCDPNFISIGNEDLIGKRTNRPVPIAPGGTLSDYIPFYFTPHSPMLYNIHTGYGGITQRRNEEIVIMVSSLRKVRDDDLEFVFADRHAYLAAAEFSSDLDELEILDWDSLRARDFKKDPEDPDKFERYQAEALVHQVMPVASLRGIAGCSPAVAEALVRMVDKEGCELKVGSRPNWYF